ncbi:hypothetical protein HSBAA_21460 [Vreelandella sulfidaeris]|uniref:Uncharacterized protein n=1 Tax=Vreelandella sulfidaeris TaxID=115553 RepID=A0A455U421_9GAMM|nr:hypothetical protein HSBAA_21460 [Halomonas sulfidaeris]
MGNGFTDSVSSSHLMFFIPGIIVMALSVKDHLKSVDVFSHLVASIINAGLGYVVAIAAKAVWLAYLNL